MACSKSFPWLGCQNCCTHRLVSDTAVVEWSRNAGERTFCDVCHETVFDAWHHAGVYYLLTATKCDSGVPTSESRDRVQAWDSDGDRLWVSEFLNDEQATGGRICSDGTDVWVTVGGATPFVYRLDALDGDVLYSSLEFDYAINYLCPDGAGSVWLAHARQSDGDGTGFVSLWSDGTISQRFGGLANTVGGGSAATNPTPYSIVADGDTLYVGHSYYRTADFENGEYCTPCGFVSRYDSGELTWISCSRIANLSPYDDAGSYPLVPLIAVDSGVLYFAFKDGSGYGAMETVAGKPQWIREIDRAIPIALCGGRSEPIRDFDAAGGTLWIVVNRWLYQLDSSGTVLDSVTHDDTDIGKNSCQFWQLNCVTANGDGGALMGGQSAECENPANEEQDSTAVAAAECDEGTDANWCSPRDWDETNDCGSLTTTGRRRVGGCTLAQSPPCEGPVVVNYTCGETTVSATIDTVASGESCDDFVSWAGSGSGIDILVTINCDGSAEVDLSIDGCTITSTTATLNCEGPFGYAAVEFTFTGTCEDCDLNGCGVLNGDDCSLTVDSPCCDEPIPQTLTATLSSAGCSAANGQTMTLEWTGLIWAGSATYGSDAWTISLGCNGTTASSCASKWAIGGASGCQPLMAFGQSGCSCAPFSVTFITTIGGSGCGPPCSGQALTVVITA